MFMKVRDYDKLARREVFVALHSKEKWQQETSQDGGKFHFELSQREEHRQNSEGHWGGQHQHEHRVARGGGVMQ